jgi:hypothetical protein
MLAYHDTHDAHRRRCGLHGADVGHVLLPHADDQQYAHKLLGHQLLAPAKTR